MLAAAAAEALGVVIVLLAAAGAAVRGVVVGLWAPGSCWRAAPHLLQHPSKQQRGSQRSHQLLLSKTQMAVCCWLQLMSITCTYSAPHPVAATAAAVVLVVVAQQALVVTCW